MKVHRSKLQNSGDRHLLSAAEVGVKQQLPQIHTPTPGESHVTHNQIHTVARYALLIFLTRNTIH